MKRKKIFANFIIVPVFLVLLYIPLVSHMFHIAIKPNLQENRQLEQKMTAGSFFEFPQQYSKYYNDHFPFRSRLIHFHHWFLLRSFGVSPVPRVIVGQKEWLFRTRENLHPLDRGYFESIKPFTTNQLKDWRNLLEQRRNWLEERGIYYLVVLTPAKSDVYPEFLPRQLQYLYSKSRLTQLADYLKTESTVPVLNLKPVIMASKKERLLYLKTDSHWNEYGAFIAHRAIINHLAQAFNLSVPMISPTDFKIIEKKKKTGGDLAIMLSLHETLYREGRVKVRPRTPYTYQNLSLPPWMKNKTVKSSLTQQERAILPGVVMFHDSFGRKLKPFLSQYFSRMLSIRDWSFSFHNDVIEVEKPKIVIDEISGHFLYDRMPVNPPELKEMIKPDSF